MTTNQLEIIIKAKVDQFHKALLGVQAELRNLKKESINTASSIDNSFKNMGVEQLEAIKQQTQDEIKTWEHSVKANEIAQKQIRNQIDKTIAEIDKLKEQYHSIIDPVNEINMQVHGTPLSEENARNSLTGFAEVADKLKEQGQILEELKKKERYRIANNKELNAYINDSRKKLEEVNGALKGAKRQTESVHKAVNSVVNIFKRSIIRRVISAIISGIKDSIDALVLMDKKLKGTLKYNKALSDISSAFKRLSISIGAVLSELLVGFAPALTVIINGLTKVVNVISAVLAMLSGKTTYSVANPNYWKDYADSLDKANKEQKKLISGFDELNTFTSNSSNTINPEELVLVKELPKVMQDIAKFNAALFGDDGSLLRYLADLGLVLEAVKLLNKWFGKKTDSLKDQTDKTNTDALAVSALATALALGASKVKDFVGKLKEFPESLPALQPQLQLQPAFSALEKLKQKFEELKPVIQPSFSLGLVTSGIAKIISLLSNIKLPQLKPSFSFSPVTEFIEKIKELWLKVKLPQLNPSINVSPVIKGLNQMVTAIQSFTSKSVSTIKSGVNTAVSSLSNGFNNAVISARNWASQTLSIVATFANNFKNNVLSAFNNTVSNIKSWATNTASTVASWAIAVAGDVRSAVTNIAQNVYNAFSNAGNNINSWAKSTFSTVKSWASSASEAIGSWAKNIVTTTANALTTAWENFKSFMKATGEKISGWFSANKQVVITSAVIAGALTAVGIALAPFTGGASLSLPAFALANGGVVDKPTTALIGEYKGAKSNPEIVTPENKMREVLEDNNSTLINGFAQMTRQIITAINDVDMEVSIGDDVIAKSASRGNNNYKRMTGKPLIV